MPREQENSRRADSATGWFVGAITAAALLAVGFLVFFAHPTPAATPLARPYVMLSDKDGHGSGVHIGNGYIITAAHVATATNGDMTLKASDGRSQSAHILWASKEFDVALMKASKPEYLGSADLDCAPRPDGEHVTAYGNPLDLEFVSSAGRITGAERKFEVWANVAPVDMTIVPGQSGGAIVNDDGMVVGIAVGVTTFNMGITGFGLIVPSTTICMLLARE